MQAYLLGIVSCISPRAPQKVPFEGLSLFFEVSRYTSYSSFWASHFTGLYSQNERALINFNWSSILIDVIKCSTLLAHATVFALKVRNYTNNIHIIVLTSFTIV